MADANVDANGVPEDTSAQVSTGALSAAPDTSAPLKTQAINRLHDTQRAFSGLQQEYADVSGHQADVYAQQKKVLQDATNRLLGINMNPSQAEIDARVQSAMMQPTSGYSGNIGAALSTKADIMQEMRKNAMAKEEMVTKYGMEVPQTEAQQLAARQNQLLQEMRVMGTQENNAANQASKNPIIGKYYTAGPDGQPVFNQDLYNQDMQAKSDAAKATQTAKLIAQQSAAGFVSPEAIEETYKTGKAPTGFSRQAYMIKALWDGVHKRAAEDGNDAATWFAQTQATNAQKNVLNDYYSGKTSQVLGKINTAVQHANVLESMIPLLNNTNSPAYNSVANLFKTQTGKAAPNSFNGVRDFVVGEIAGATLPEGGGETERQALAQEAKNSSSPQMLEDIMRRWSQLLAGKTNTLRQRWDMTTRGEHGSFDQKFLLPATRKALGISDAPPVTGAPPAGSTIMADPILRKYLPKTAPVAQ